MIGSQTIDVDNNLYNLLYGHLVLERGGVSLLKMKRILVALPAPLKAKLDMLRAKGYSASGFIRAVLERELNQVQVKDQKGR